jgi:Na+-transporting NADH:ubiquinone oxidoreductase subunit C
LKKGGADKNNPHEVDAITGGTKTSDGVSAMIKDCLQSYKPYFMASKVAVNEVSNEQNTENNGK